MPSLSRQTSLGILSPLKVLHSTFFSGEPLIADALIAATAIMKGIPLVSKNQRDYRFIEELALWPYPMEGLA